MAVQIWIILGLVIGLAFILHTVLVPVVLKKSFRAETYTQIEETQNYIFKNARIDEIKDNKILFCHLNINLNIKNQPPPRVVRHIVLSQGNNINSELYPAIIQKMREEAEQQTEEVQRYTGGMDDKKIYYVIRKFPDNVTQQFPNNDEKIYLISYLKQRTMNNFYKDIFRRLTGTLIFILLITWIASIAIAKYLSRPLVHLQSRVRDIAARKWDRAISLDRGDEIGELEESIDWMRLQLKKQDEKQQSFLQQISHELKTPVMVIRSYVQSINDGIFPGGDMKSSLKVIEEETERLEKRVQFLLGYTKYEYLAKHNLQKKEFNITRLIEQTIQNFMWRNSELQWEFNLEEDVMAKGDREKIKIALENILDNQLRYAEDIISITLSKNETIKLKFWNDGPEIPDNKMKDLFVKFQKGYEGNFGLGLAIVKLIIEMHEGSVWASNEDGGAAFYIEF